VASHRGGWFGFSLQAGGSRDVCLRLLGKRLGCLQRGAHLWVARRLGECTACTCFYCHLLPPCTCPMQESQAWTAGENTPLFCPTPLGGMWVLKDCCLHFQHQRNA
jgi:hypothetical protein